MGDDDLQTDSDERALDRVPRSLDEEALLLSTRPPAWEYLLFGAVLLRKNKELEPKWQEHETGKRRAGTTAMTIQQAVDRLSDEPLNANEIVDRMVAYLDPGQQERAFGKPGESGDPQRITDLAEGIISGCDELLEWCAALRVTGVPRELRRLFDLTSELADLPLQQTRVFVDNAVRQFDDIPAAIREARPVQLRLALTLTIDEAIVSQHKRESQKVSKLF